MKIESNKIHYPQFGEKCSTSKGQRIVELLERIAKIALLAIAAAAIGLLAGGPIGAAIGASAALGASLVASLVVAASRHLSKKRFLQQLPDHLPQESKLGKYYNADIYLTKTADAGFKWKKELIKSAEESIELSANFAGGKDFQEVLQLIDKKMSTNGHVKTHLLISHDLLEDDDKNYLNTLKEKFPERFYTLITDRQYKLGLDYHSEENHVKMLVVDGKYFVAGGTGIHPRLNRERCNRHQIHNKIAPSSTVLERSSRDADIVGKGTEIAAVMRHQFFNLYRIWEIRTNSQDANNRFFPLEHTPGHSALFERSRGRSKNVRMKCIVGGPEHGAHNPIVKQYQKRILKAKKRLNIANWTFCPIQPLRHALHTAKRNNPNLKRVVVHNGLATRSTLGRFMQAHAGRGFFYLADKVYEHVRPDQIYHKKVATFDDSHMMIGSFNFTKKSASYDHEIAFVIKDERITKKCHTVLKHDKTHANKVDLQRSFTKRIKEKVVSFLLVQFMKNLI